MRTGTRALAAARRPSVPALAVWVWTMLGRSARNRLLRSRSTDRSREGRTSRAISGIILGSTPRSRAYQTMSPPPLSRLPAIRRVRKPWVSSPRARFTTVDGGPAHVQARDDPMDEEAVFRQSRSAFTIQRCGVSVRAPGMRAVALRASTTTLECSITLA